MNPFVERWLEPLWIGTAVHLWQTGLFLLALFLVARLMRNAPARLLSALYWVGVLKLLLPLPLLGEGTRILMKWAGTTLASGVTDGEAGWTTVTVFMYPSLFGPASSAMDGAVGAAYLALTAFWFVGAYLVAARWLRSARLAQVGAARRIEGCPERLRARLRNALAGTGLPPQAIRIGQDCSGPSVRGVLRPVVVLPATVTDGLEPEELRAILVHEREHWLRRDPLRYAVLALVRAMFFFFPPVWWLARRIHETTEMACDEAVVRAGFSADGYCRSLARTLTLGLAAQPVANPIGIFGHRASFLLRRLERVRSHRRIETMTSHRLIVAVAAVAALAISVLPLAPGSASEVRAGTPPDAAEQSTHEVPEIRIAGTDGVSNPVLIKESKVLPTYPELARKSKTMGRVILQAMIDRNGTVRDIEVMNVEPKGNKEFADSAVKAVKQWRYEPATSEGKPVDVYFTIRIDYKLDSHKPSEKKDAAEAGGPVT